jgi:hypothetical protein
MNTHNATEPPASAHEVPYGSNVEPYRDVDIFHSDDAVQAFANQTYQSAREKFLWGMGNEIRVVAVLQVLRWSIDLLRNVFALALVLGGSES